MYDVIIIGAGVGGLTCASKLALNAKRVLILEKIHHIGGTSNIFKRGNYIFPMGPLSVSFPNFIKEKLEEAGIHEDFAFRRSHFQLISPEIDIIYSKEWDKFENQLKEQYKEDQEGIEKFFMEFNQLLEAICQIHKWHPEYLVGKKRELTESKLLEDHKEAYEIIETYSKISSKTILDDYLKYQSLKRLLGSQGSYEPTMNMVHLAFMWNVMSIEGIWFPNCGIHGINELLGDSIRKNGGEIRLNTPVNEIIIENNKAIGVKIKGGKLYRAHWIVANADYKKVFLELINPNKVSKLYLDVVKNTAYTGSEFCVYLGINPEKVDLSRIRADHLFYRAKILKSQDIDNEDFENKEIEICLWSNKSSDFAPEGMKSLVLRVNMPYKHFERWRIGEKKRKKGYKEYKYELAEKLIDTVEQVLPGLSSSIQVKEIATPLTYNDWGQRYRGSIAGWSRDIKKIRIKSKLLLQGPIERLLTVGIYSVLEPFLGGYPVSMYTGSLAADLILEKS
ncbi:MAG: phytoene desaturase family protein [Candidatus Thorarchaeota archaeon]